MKQTIKLYDIYSADLFTLSRASELRSSIDEKADEVTLDFEGVSFMSRSFADEVCNIIDDIRHGEPFCFPWCHVILSICATSFPHKISSLISCISNKNLVKKTSLV